MSQKQAALMIQVLGSGCPECGDLAERAVAAAAELSPGCVVEVIGDLYEILAYNVMTTPALVINGEVVASGWVPTAAEIHTLIRERM